MNPRSFPNKEYNDSLPLEGRAREGVSSTVITPTYPPPSRGRNKSGQAAIELAVFGAILIFILGTIVRSALGNGYAQNQNFKAMRMAMLASWQGTGLATGPGAYANTAHNSASVLFVEDRLSPDFNKYGDLDRNPFIAQGSGTFSYNLFYSWQPGESVANLIPIMDVWINGQHFPFSTASYVTRTITRSMPCSSDCQNSTPQQQQCLRNQISRNQREWVGGTVNESQFYNIVTPPVPVSGCPITTGSQTDIYIECDAWAIFNELANEGYISLVGTQGAVVNSSVLSSTFTGWLSSEFSESPAQAQTQANQIQSILQSSQTQYKLFYTMAVNGASQAEGATLGGKGAPQFLPYPPQTCSGTNNALCASLTVLDANGNPYTNTTGDMQYDLLRLGYYTTDPPSCASPPCESVDRQFPFGGPMRNYIAWQWAATPGTTAASIGLDPDKDEYPQYDIDGRLKPVTIYAISQAAGGAPTVTYEDPDGGDIDGGWDSNSCGPKPGLQSDSQIFTFTKQGTYLQILEGKLYDPETDQFVRSANKRDNVDLIQRTIQLSNNTGRFCDAGGNRLSTVANDGVTPNPVEACIPAGSGGNCFSGSNGNGQIIAQTCYDETDYKIFVRSRFEERRGHFWMTDTSGQLQVK